MGGFTVGGHTVRSRMHMRQQREHTPIASLLEERQPGHQPDHRRQMLAIQRPNHNHKHSHDHRQRVHQDLLRPQTARHPIDEIRQDPAQGPEHRVEQPVHGRPAPGARLALLREVLEVVGAQEGVDGELGAEGAEVGDD